MFLPQRMPGHDWLGVVVAIPEPWVTELTDLRLRLGDLQGAMVPAHITILPPTSLPTDQRPDIIRHLREVAKHHRPFRITLKGADSFRPVSQVAFLELSEGAAQCTQLADDVRTPPLDDVRRFPYHPHVTLAQDVDDPALDLAVDVGEQFEASWMVPGFRLDRVDENGMYQTMALFDFEATTP
ncbi:2'-5' RNA ligase family protein [Actinomyces mediterranea]|uniref:2'-5' RNA ligase family protein n=1 Tax=Actinomyces mediterranea TaxID=1871028 RepID=UPI0009714A92|nr:2'-5' RNA ligase family protein [Actinomyces mediterranea]